MNSQSDNLLKTLPGDDILSQCIHCGFCLSSCPTYELTKLETSSPRGRIKLIKSVAYGDLPVTEAFADEMNFCLDCQACETACPAGVKYGEMVEAARSLVDKEKKYGSFIERFIKKTALKYIISSRRNLKIVAHLLRIYQKTGLKKLLHKIKFFKLLPGNISEIDLMAPEISAKFSDELIDEITKPQQETLYKTAFHFGCIMNVMFADINLDTIEVLKAAGCEIFTPENQVCCGSLQAHHGEPETAKKLAKKNIYIFLQKNYQYLISNSAGCGAFMKEYVNLFKDDPEYSVKAKIFSEKVLDFSEFFVKIVHSLKFKNADKNITYHDACHLVHTQKVFNQPREMLLKIPGINFNNLEESTWCCGSAGLYNVIRYKDSIEMLKRKMKNIGDTNSEIVISGNPGCISQINYGAKKFNMNIKSIHPATLIRQSLDE